MRKVQTQFTFALALCGSWST
uniref:Uncharacterized protein n=1 Tax=mine drainage metagenome TaxID=410659 RepID=E6PHD3_9ZZZZ